MPPVADVHTDFLMQRFAVLPKAQHSVRSFSSFHSLASRPPCPCSSLQVVDLLAGVAAVLDAARPRAPGKVPPLTDATVATRLSSQPSNNRCTATRLNTWGTGL